MGLVSDLCFFLYLLSEYFAFVTLFSDFYRKNVNLGILGISSIRIRGKNIILYSYESGYYIYIKRNSYDKFLLYDRMLILIKQGDFMAIVPLFGANAKDINNLNIELSSIQNIEYEKYDNYILSCKLTTCKNFQEKILLYTDINIFTICTSTIIWMIVPFFIFNEYQLNNNVAYIILLSALCIPLRSLFSSLKTKREREKEKREIEEYKYSIRKNKILFEHPDGVIFSLRKNYIKTIAQRKQEKFVILKNLLAFPCPMCFIQKYPQFPIFKWRIKIARFILWIFCVVYYLIFIIYNFLILNYIRQG